MLALFVEFDNTIASPVLERHEIVVEVEVESKDGFHSDANEFRDRVHLVGEWTGPVETAPGPDAFKVGGEGGEGVLDNPEVEASFEGGFEFDSDFHGAFLEDEVGKQESVGLHLDEFASLLEGAALLAPEDVVLLEEDLVEVEDGHGGLLGSAGDHDEGGFFEFLEDVREVELRVVILVAVVVGRLEVLVVLALQLFLLAEDALERASDL